MKKILIVSMVGLFLICGLRVAKAEGSYFLLGTSDSQDGSADAINFSQGRVWTIDQYGKYIWLTQNRNGEHHWAWSNDLGSNWTQGSETYQFLMRGSVAYDVNNDKLHVIWNGQDANDGVIYRRYGITRDGSNNITAITREDAANINLQLDTSASRTLDQPVAIWVNDGSTNGILVAIWTKVGSSLNEVRGSMRKLTLSSADGIAGNWQALDDSEDTFSTDAPLVEADKIYGTTSGSVGVSAIVRGGTGSLKDDLYVFADESQGRGNDEVRMYRASWNSINQDWSNGWNSVVGLATIDNTSGYNLKHQLISKPVYDSTNDRLYVAWSHWKDNSAGDTVSFGYLNCSDTMSSIYDVYSANGTHSYAPTFDIAYDSNLNLVYIAYIESTTNGDNGSINYKSFDGSNLSSATRFYTSTGGSGGQNGSADIPILFESRSNNRLLMAFRINGSLPPSALDPHTIYWGYVTLASATPTPTPTPTLIPSPTEASSNNATHNQPSTTGPATCNDSQPSEVPDLFQIKAEKTSAKLFFSPVKGANKYFISYGIKPNEERYGVEFPTDEAQGVQLYQLNSLNPLTTYYVRIRGGNGCMPGKWGNEMKFTTNRLTAVGTKIFYKNLLTRIVANFFDKTTKASQSGLTSGSLSTNNCQYVVLPGDSLWKIAEKNKGNGNDYKLIKDLNKQNYPSLNLTDKILPGWNLKLKC